MLPLDFRHRKKSILSKEHTYATGTAAACFRPQ